MCLSITAVSSGSDLWIHIPNNLIAHKVFSQLSCFGVDMLTQCLDQCPWRSSDKMMYRKTWGTDGVHDSGIYDKSVAHTVGREAFPQKSICAHAQTHNCRTAGAHYHLSVYLVIALHNEMLQG